MVSLPRVVIAAPGSGQGKTTVATGLMAALRARGLAVSGHKAGPDYIDPGYHALATGRPGRNLDPVLCGEDLIAPLFAHGAAGADVAVVEGVMGLFDGRGRTSFGSTAHVARLLAAPVLLVVDAAAQGRSVAALVAGFAGYDPRVRVAGVILNRVGSAWHEEILRAALDDLGVPVLGALRRDEAVAAPSRHLGLVPVAEREGPARQALDRLGAVVGAAVDLEALLRLAASAGPLGVAAWSPEEALAGARPIHPGHPTGPTGPAGTADPSDRGHPASLTDPTGPGHPTVPAGSTRTVDPTDPGRPAGPIHPIDLRGPVRPPGHVGRAPVVALAGGAAFSFSYAETAELLAAAGAEVARVDPLRDEALPAGTAALVLGGGFPEVHVADLAANEPLRADVARLARAGRPVIAECAGLLYLARELDGQPMCGVLDATAGMTGRLTLGYRDATAAANSVVAPAGVSVRGHEFHRTTVDPPHSPSPAWTFGGRPEGFVRQAVHASYLHLHWAGYPELARRVVEAAAA
jgi:cobyrinic acid a,c-diamide synthase